MGAILRQPALKTGLRKTADKAVEKPGNPIALLFLHTDRDVLPRDLLVIQVVGLAVKHQFVLKRPSQPFAAGQAFHEQHIVAQRVAMRTGRLVWA